MFAKYIVCRTGCWLVSRGERQDSSTVQTGLRRGGSFGGLGECRDSEWKKQPHPSSLPHLKHGCSDLSHLTLKMVPMLNWPADGSTRSLWMYANFLKCNYSC